MQIWSVVCAFPRVAIVSRDNKLIGYGIALYTVIVQIPVQLIEIVQIVLGKAYVRELNR